jgi:hypothetical protein
MGGAIFKPTPTYNTLLYTQPTNIALDIIPLKGLCIHTFDSIAGQPIL